VTSGDVDLDLTDLVPVGNSQASVAESSDHPIDIVAPEAFGKLLVERLKTRLVSCGVSSSL
jgi:hypothetical protein